MSEFKFMETLQQKSENSGLEDEFLIGNDTLWVSQKVIAELFGTTSPNISKQYRNIIYDQELIEHEVSVKSKILFHEESDLITRDVNRPNIQNGPRIWYNLDAVISMGFRVNSEEATRFRKWSNTILKEYMVKGFVFNEELIKNGGHFADDYYDELLEKIREIRASDRRYNQKISDLFMTSYDYDKNSQLTMDFFANAPNTLIYAVSKHTAAEIINWRSDENAINMGLTNWSDSPNGKILASDVVISRNYLTEEELVKLNNLIDGFLTLVENRAIAHEAMAMEDWKGLLEEFIALNKLPVLMMDDGISLEEAKSNAREKFKKFRKIQDKNFISDFDQIILDLKNLKK